MKTDRSNDTMDLSSLSKEELTRNLRSLQRPGAESAGAVPDDWEDMIQELQVHRVELEMQNRALREMEAEVEAALQRYCDLYDHLPIGYLTLTRNGRIVQANLTAAGWLRRDRAQLVDGYLNWFFDAFDAGRFAAHLEACVQTGREQTLEVTLRLESGVLLTVHLTSRLASSSGEGEPHVHTAITNISKMKQAHAVVEDIDREQENFTQSLADHLQTPLIAISKFARTMLQEHPAELSSEIKSMIERMECAALRMESTLQHLLEYCSLGHEEVALDPVNLEELMQHVMVEHRLMIEHRRAEITVDRPLPCVRGARLLLGQVLANILTNTLKRTGPGQTPRIRIRAEQHGDEVVLTVADEGTPPTVRQEDRDFGMLERRRERDCYSGTGVGLAILRRTVERMNGRVWVETAFGKGTTFHIGLPAD